MGIERASIQMRMKAAIKQGVNVTRFRMSERAAGRKVYRWTDLTADYRRFSGQKAKAGRMRFVRKDRYPATAQMAGLSDTASKEFLYKLRYSSVIKPVREEDWKFVNIMSDVPLTPEMLEAEAEKQWGEWEKYRPETVIGLQVWSVFRKGIE